MRDSGRWGDGESGSRGVGKIFKLDFSARYRSVKSVESARTFVAELPLVRSPATNSPH
ncbi:MAG: hypothetical protein WBA89_04400 [Microcoleus sp.]|uniref:hypothetical protein n=1 Tax=Microcoleus sp. TaxID=44472 RepID=UPI003C7345B6